MADIEALRALHAPSRASYAWIAPKCDGCDVGGYEGCSPEWPCRTADLLWDEQGRAAILADWKQWARARHDEITERQATEPSLIPEVWQQRILDQFKATPTIGNLFNTRPVDG